MRGVGLQSPSGPRSERGEAELVSIITAAGSQRREDCGGACDVACWTAAVGWPLGAQNVRSSTSHHLISPIAAQLGGLHGLRCAKQTSAHAAAGSSDHARCPGGHRGQVLHASTAMDGAPTRRRRRRFWRRRPRKPQPYLVVLNTITTRHASRSHRFPRSRASLGW